MPRTTFIVGFFISITILGIGFFIYDYERSALQRNAQLYAAAIERGIHPLVIRCAVDNINHHNQTMSAICITIASSKSYEDQARKIQGLLDETH